VSHLVAVLCLIHDSNNVMLSVGSVLKLSQSTIMWMCPVIIVNTSFNVKQLVYVFLVLTVYYYRSYSC